MFLAIAVDNLGTAQDMTAAMNAEAAMLAEEKERLENEDDMPDEEEERLLIDHLTYQTIQRQLL